MKYVVYGHVLAVEECKVSHHISGFGEKAQFVDTPIGWRVSIAVGDSRIGLIFPGDKPDLDGPVTITIENKAPPQPGAIKSITLTSGGPFTETKVEVETEKTK